MGLSCVALVYKTNLQVCFTTLNQKKMKVEILANLIESKPAFLVEADGFQRVYQAVNIFEIKSYLMLTYPRICFSTVAEIPPHFRDHYKCVVFDLVSH